MKLHRFYVDADLELTNKVWVNDQNLLHQWTKVLRFRPNRQIVLFNNQKEERLYNIDIIEPKAVHLSLVTEMAANTPKNEVYLCFSLLKKDNINLVLQKGTELGVRHFVPLITGRTEKTGFDVERSKKIVIEASEQCGRADIPRVRDPITIDKILQELIGNCKLYIAEQGLINMSGNSDLNNEKVAVFVGPEGGWTDEEKALFIDNNIEHLVLSQFVLRSETACITAAVLLCK